MVPASAPMSSPLVDSEMTELSGASRHHLHPYVHPRVVLMGQTRADHPVLAPHWAQNVSQWALSMHAGVQCLD